MKTNYERANHGVKDNQDVRIAHQMRQVLRREVARLKKQKEASTK